MFESKKNTTLKIVLIVWLVFSILYVVQGEYNRLENHVAKKAFDQGVSTAAVKIINEAQTCQAIPIVANEQRVELINMKCFQQVPQDGGEE